MASKLLIADNGTILEWDVAGVQVLTPHVDGETPKNARGGLPLCVPMFSVQQREVRGSHLPLHGILMYEPQESVTTLVEGQTWKRVHTYEPSATYSWKWSVALELSLDADSLTYSITITRAAGCTNEDDMPISLGFHPYFNTFGEDFAYTIAGHTTHKQEVPKDIINSTFAPLVPGESATFTTAKGTLTITPQGYDEYCLWTDKLDTYFCIEPIFQYREYGLPGTRLSKDTSHKAVVTLQFLPFL
jgi:galactose mutarotase-like enzyme